jgi:hypothetical protein
MLFRFIFQPLHALIVSIDNNNQLCELWNQMMAHLYHGDIGGIIEVVTRVPQFSSDHRDVCKGFFLVSLPKLLF